MLKYLTLIVSEQTIMSLNHVPLPYFSFKKKKKSHVSNLFIDSLNFLGSDNREFICISERERERFLNLTTAVADSWRRVNMLGIKTNHFGTKGCLLLSRKLLRMRPPAWLPNAQ